MRRLLVLLSLAACGEAPPAHEAPASVSNVVPENEITTVTLTAQAETRLGIKVAPLEKRVLAAVRTLGGEVVVPPGKALLVTAPVAGSVLPADSVALYAGAAVRARQSLLQLMPLPPDRDLARSREDLSVAEARYAEARLEAERVQKLYTDRLVATREHERAQANLQATEATLQTARAQFQAITEGAAAQRTGVAPLAIRSPVRGIVRSLYVAPGQTVAAGSPLFEVAQLDRLWVRVPVYVGDVAELAIDREAAVVSLGDVSGARTARPVRAPPSANPNAASADIFYELLGAAGGLRPGERVNVAISLRSGSSEQLVVPWSAILHDAQGGAWVYEQVKTHVYARRRVDLSHVQGDLAVLARGPAPGTRIVFVGAAELFGTEFGAGH